MPFLDTLKDGLARIIPEKHSMPSSMSMGGGIGNHGGHGMVEDDMIVSKPAIVFHASQIFFNFLAMACFASVAAFQAKWGVGPSGLSGFTLFITVAGMLLSSFMLAVPVVYEKYDKMIRLARALKEVRVGFILTGAGTVASLLISFIVTISAWTEPGCKNPDNDPNADKGDDFKNGLSGWCNTKKAAAIFLWLAFVFWAASLILLIINWRQGKLLGPRDPPFQHPEADEYEEDEEAAYHVAPARQPSTDDHSIPPNPFADSNRYSAASGGQTPAYAIPSRPSMDAYGAFSDPEPTGFNLPPSTGPPMIPEQDFSEAPRVSRTMQYADPYAAVRASIGGTGANSQPPTYESYAGYR